MKFRTSINDLIGSKWHQYAVSRTGIDLPNCFTAATMLISEAIGYNQSLDDRRVNGAGQLWEYHHPNFTQSKYAQPGALMIWKGGPDGFGHVAFCEKIVSNTVVGWLESNYYDHSKLSEYKELNPNYAFQGLTFVGYLVHKDLGKSASNKVSLTSEHAVATLKVDGVNARLESPSGKIVRTYNTGDKIEYTHKCQTNGHRYVVWEEHEHKIFMAVSATEARPVPGSAEEWATFSAVAEKPKPKPIPKPTDDNVTAHGIDISEANANIDYKKYDFAILRSSWGENKDKLFDHHVSKCNGSDVKVGVYHFAYALNEEQARAEIKYFLDTVKDVNVQFGYWLDLEENTYWSKHGLNTPKHFTMIAKIWDEIMSDRGLYHGIYAGKYWFDNFIKTNVEHKWIAQWGNDDAIRDDDLSSECVLHQYTSNHNTLDENVCYVDESEFITEKSNQELLNDIKHSIQILEERLG